MGDTSSNEGVASEAMKRRGIRCFTSGVAVVKEEGEGQQAATAGQSRKTRRV